VSADGAIRVWDRRAGRPVEERIYGERGLRWLYGTTAGRWIAPWLAGPGPSTLLGVYYDSRHSTRKIEAFVRDYGIALDEYVEEPWDSFNRFFVRRFRNGARTFEPDAGRMPAFAEGRYLAFGRVTPEIEIPVKGACLRPGAVLSPGPDGTGAGWVERFEGGPLFVARLCPVDYHRYHYPDGGTTRAAWRVSGGLHSVHPIALAARGDVLCTNERRVAILDTDGFGLLAYVEVGAFGVGRIVQTHPEGRRFERGDEKGQFRFGASTVLVFGEAGRWLPDDDLLERSARGDESLVRLGEGIARVHSG
jgi:phosphatidylserine decarboxylase